MLSEFACLLELPADLSNPVHLANWHDSPGTRTLPGNHPDTGSGLIVRLAPASMRSTLDIWQQRSRMSWRKPPMPLFIVMAQDSHLLAQAPDAPMRDGIELEEFLSEPVARWLRRPASFGFKSGKKRPRLSPPEEFPRLGPVPVRRLGPQPGTRLSTQNQVDPVRLRVSAGGRSGDSGNAPPAAGSRPRTSATRSGPGPPAGGPRNPGRGRRTRRPACSSSRERPVRRSEPAG